MYWDDYYRPYVSIAERRAEAAREIAKLAKKGRKISPVRIEGRKIAHTFWGKAWCENLESYSDYENRLPRGRTYVRNGSVLDLQIQPGRITALVSGSSLYKIEIRITTLVKDSWQGIKRECAGKIGSLIELLQGKLSEGVMGIITRRPGGMFPAPKEISLTCSCPDWAGMCKHLAAVLYGVGARLDHEPELLFKLRQVDHLDLIAQAGDLEGILKPASAESTIAHSDLADVFGIELEAEPVLQSASPALSQPPASPARSKRLPKAAKRHKTVKPKTAPKRRPGRQTSHELL
jgi:uncharacterized Zn finger protein